MEQVISAVRTPDYDPDALLEAVRRHLELTGTKSLFRPGVKVLLKPNLLMKRRPDEATTTHPALVEAVALALRELGVADITLADSPGGPYTRSQLEGIYQTTGMAGLVGRTGVKLNYDTGWQAVECGDGTLVKSLPIINPVLEADVVVNLPKLKTHAMMLLSGGVKNLFGCVPGLQKPEQHFRFPEKAPFGRMLVELAEQVRPGLSIVDAVVAMEGDGPSGGTPRALGWTLAGHNIFLLDEVLCKMAGLRGEEVPSIAWAREAGLSSALPFPEPVGDGMPTTIPPLAAPRSKDVDFAMILPGPLQGVGRRLLTPRPVIRSVACIGCGKCAESCPASTIGLTGGKAKIAYHGCIRCYCCHEMCPVRAIEIRRPRLLGW